MPKSAGLPLLLPVLSAQSVLLWPPVKDLLRPGVVTTTVKSPSDRGVVQRVARIRRRHPMLMRQVVKICLLDAYRTSSWRLALFSFRKLVFKFKHIAPFFWLLRDKKKNVCDEFSLFFFFVFFSL
jgi:hypothetical protein